MSCFCENVAVGSYDHQVLMKCPFKTSHDGMVSIDVCIATEVAELWHQGVYTLASCCGHGKWPAAVGVAEGHERRMGELEYRRDPQRPDLWRLRTGTPDLCDCVELELHERGSQMCVHPPEVF